VLDDRHVVGLENSKDAITPDFMEDLLRRRASPSSKLLSPDLMNYASLGKT